MDTSANGLMSYSSWGNEQSSSSSVLQRDSNSGKDIDHSFLVGARAMFLGGPLNILGPFIFLGVLSYYCNWNEGVTFAFALLGIAPLAERLGFCTEQLAIHTNDSIGGLLNATFGNATEVIVGITALSRGLYRVVQLSLLGSILSNLLLVLGCAFFFGGLKYKTQTFGKISSQMSSTLLILATMCLVFPALLTNTNDETHSAELSFSRGVSIILLITYCVFVYFQIVTHRHLYEEDDGENADDDAEKQQQAAASAAAATSSSSVNGNHTPSTVVENLTPFESPVASPKTHIPMVGSPANKRSSFVRHASIGRHPTLATSNEESRTESQTASLTENILNSSSPAPAPTSNIEIVKLESTEKRVFDDEEDILGFNYACIWLAIITVFIAILSDAISATIEDAGTNYNISAVFLSTIVLPIIGNAAEHASAIIFGMRNNLDLSLGIAVGSSCQIAVLVIPLMVIVGWMMDKDMSLDFGVFESFTLFITVVGVTFAIKDGTSNYYLGVILIVAYFIIAAGFMARNDEPLDTAR